MAPAPTSTSGFALWGLTTAERRRARAAVEELRAAGNSTFSAEREPALTAAAVALSLLDGDFAPEPEAAAADDDAAVSDQGGSERNRALTAFGIARSDEVGRAEVGRLHAALLELRGSSCGGAESTASGVSRRAAPPHGASWWRRRGSLRWREEDVRVAAPPGEKAFSWDDARMRRASTRSAFAAWRRRARRPSMRAARAAAAEAVERIVAAGQATAAAAAA
eukprot:949308-Prymnesium_polylepis.1